MPAEMKTITRLMLQEDRTYKPVQFDVTIDLSKLDAAVFHKAVRQQRVRGMNGAIQVVRSPKLTGTKP